MKHYIFETKENYLQMKQQWATYFNTEARNLERNKYGNKERKLTATHFALYAILRGKDPFTSLNSCCYETLEKIQIHVMRTQLKWYNSHWATFFGLTAEEEQRMLAIADDIFRQKKNFKTIQNNLKEAVTA